MEANTSKQLIQSPEKIDNSTVPNVEVLELSVPAEPEIRKIIDFDIEESYELAGYNSDGDTAPQQTHWDKNYTETSVNTATGNNGKQKNGYEALTTNSL